jgi:hypothetical protein
VHEPQDTAVQGAVTSAYGLNSYGILPRCRVRNVAPSLRSDAPVVEYQRPDGSIGPG